MKQGRAGWLANVAVAMAIVSATPLSLAQQPDAKQVAVEKVRFKAAQQLYDKNDFAGALSLFQDVVRLNNSPNARLYAARCLRDLGRLPEAYEELTIATRDADTLATKEPRYAATRDAAATERAALASKVALLTIALADQPDGLVLKVGDRAIDLTRLRDPVALLPGAVVVDASAPGRDAFRKDLKIAAGSSETLAIVLPASGPAKTAPKTPDVPQSSGTIRKAGFAVLGVGALGGVTFAVAGIMANKKYDEVFKACGGVHCTDPKFDDEISTGQTLDTVANIGLVVGVAGILGGAAMVVFGGPKEIPVSAGANSEGGWITYRGKF